MTGTSSSMTTIVGTGTGTGTGHHGNQTSFSTTAAPTQTKEAGNAGGKVANSIAAVFVAAIAVVIMGM